jgi:hypothetical protein
MTCKPRPLSLEDENFRLLESFSELEVDNYPLYGKCRPLLFYKNNKKYIIYKLFYIVQLHAVPHLNPLRS